jgi:CopG antitoxin of type II toxin-antitoxin system
MQPVERWSDVPAFASERQEHDFWATHELAGEALESMREDAPDWLPPPEAFRQFQQRTRPISVRLDNDVLRRLKALAAKKRKGYQSLLKEFLVERLYEEEKREGLLG